MTSRDKILSLGVSANDYAALAVYAANLNKWDLLQCGCDPLPGYKIPLVFTVGKKRGMFMLWDEYVERLGVTQCVEQDDAGHWEMSWRGHNSLGVYQVVRKPTEDIGAGYLAKIGAIVSQYPDLVYYHQTDARGYSIYIASRKELAASGHTVENLDCIYPTQAYVVM